MTKLNKMHMGLASALILISGVVEAHTLAGSIPASKTAVVKWKATCPAPTQKMIFRLQQAQAKKFAVSLTVTAGDKTATVVTSKMAKIWTPFAEVPAGAGDYILSLTKSGTNTSGAIAYTIQEHCDDAGKEIPQKKPVRVR